MGNRERGKGHEATGKGASEGKSGGRRTKDCPHQGRRRGDFFLNLPSSDKFNNQDSSHPIRLIPFGCVRLILVCRGLHRNDSIYFGGGESSPLSTMLLAKEECIMIWLLCKVLKRPKEVEGMQRPKQTLFRGVKDEAVGHFIYDHISHPKDLSTSSRWFA